jgi:hypothetical protein
MSKNNKRQIALSVHFLIGYLLYNYYYSGLTDNNSTMFLHLIYCVPSVPLLFISILALDKILSFFFHADGYTGEKTIVNDNVDIVERMFLPNFLLNTIDFLTFGLSRSFFDTFY